MAGLGREGDIVTRAYSDIKVIDEINVSSSSDYFGRVVYHYQGKRFRRDVHVNNGTVMGFNESWDVKMPVYFMRELWRQYIAILEAGAIFYEYDRDGMKRFGNLRYHDQRMVDHMLTWMKREATTHATR